MGQKGKFYIWYEKAAELYIKGRRSIKEITEITGVSDKTLGKWKSEYDWDIARRDEILKVSDKDRLKEALFTTIETYGDIPDRYFVETARELRLLITGSEPSRKMLKPPKGYLEYKETPVMTTDQLAKAYEVESDLIWKNFSRNKERYENRKDYYILQGEELKHFLQTSNCQAQNIEKFRQLYLWTRRGALLHAKSLNSDTAWDIYNRLVDSYFAFLGLRRKLS